MKKCTICKQELPETEFNKNKRTKDGLQTLCRTCSQKRSRNYYKGNLDKHRKVVAAIKRKHNKRNKLNIESVKDSNGCALCVENDPCCIDFHHLDPSEKVFTIGEHRHTGSSWERIKKEISKCA